MASVAPLIDAEQLDGISTNEDVETSEFQFLRKPLQGIQVHNQIGEDQIYILRKEPSIPLCKTYNNDLKCSNSFPNIHWI